MVSPAHPAVIIIIVVINIIININVRVQWGRFGRFSKRSERFSSSWRCEGSQSESRRDSCKPSFFVTVKLPLWLETNREARAQPAPTRTRARARTHGRTARFPH